jgi:hypothetical protein
MEVGKGDGAGSARQPALVGTPLQYNRSPTQRDLKTAKHENKQQDLHRFACHIDTQGRAISRILIQRMKDRGLASDQ